MKKLLKNIWEHIYTFGNMVLKMIGFLIFAIIAYPIMWVRLKIKNGRRKT